MSSQLRLFQAEPRKNRILIGLDDQTLVVLNRFSKAIKKPRSRVASEFLQMLTPVMSEYAERIEELNRLGDIDLFKSGMESVVERMRLSLMGQNHEI
jgi:hypothetical protein